MLSQSKRLRLRVPEPADAQLLYQWENDPGIWHVGDTLVPYSMFQIEEFILNSADIYANKQLRLMIETLDRKPSQIIGAIDMYDFDPRHSRAGIGIMIVAAERGKGFAGEALQAFEQYAFQTLNLHQLYCYVAVDNAESIRVFEKRGYKQTGLRKDWLNEGGKYTDQLQFQLINPNHQLI